MTLTAEQLAELIRRHPQPRRKKPPEAKPVVTLATANPEVPLERQRERLSEAQQRLIADEQRRLEAEKKHEAWLTARQAAIDFHVEMIRANEEAERRFRRNDPCGLWSRAR
jgi:hypothetical protein